MSIVSPPSSNGWNIPLSAKLHDENDKKTTIIESLNMLGRALVDFVV
jgi:hypothetical protein